MAPEGTCVSGPRLGVAAEAWFWATVAAAALPGAGLAGLAHALVRSAPAGPSVLHACFQWIRGPAGRELLAPILLALSVPAVRTIHSALRRVRATRRWLRLLDVCEVPAWEKRHRCIIDRAGLAGRIQLVDLPRAGSWTVGLWRPRIVVTTALLQTLTEDEFCAVLHHELYHLRRRDPMKTLLARALRDGLGWVPAVAASAAAYALVCELAADAAALRRSPAATLRSALLKCERTRGLDPAGIGEVAAPSFTSAARLRLARMQQRHPGGGSRWPVVAWVETLLATLAAWGLVAAACGAALR